VNKIGMQLQTKTLIILTLLISCAFAIKITSPFQKEVGFGDKLNLGTIGPGQTVFIQIEPKVNSGGIHNEGGIYDSAYATNIPPKWQTTPSKLYGNPLQVTVTADPQAQEGEYTALIKVEDELDGEKLGVVTLNATVRITYDVMDFEVEPKQMEVGPGQPAKFQIVIENKGSTGDVFEVSAQGQKRWEFKKQVYVPANSKVALNYEVIGDEEEEFEALINVTSVASSKISDSQNVKIKIKSNLIGDMKATNQGAMIFPMFESIIYSFAGIISNLF
jgi:hypothetical protein